MAGRLRYNGQQVNGETEVVKLKGAFIKKEGIRKQAASGENDTLLTYSTAKSQATEVCPYEVVLAVIASRLSVTSWAFLATLAWSRGCGSWSQDGSVGWQLKGRSDQIGQTVVWKMNLA